MASDETISRAASPGSASPNIEDPHLQAMHEVVLQAQDSGTPNTYWYCGGGRGLFAEERNGCWFRIDYVFPIANRVFELRWSDGLPPRLWSVDRARGKGEANDYLAPEQMALRFPAEELQRMETVMQNVPHSLWARLIKLALDAHFADPPFRQRAREPRPERRSAPRPQLQPHE